MRVQTYQCHIYILTGAIGCCIIPSSGEEVPMKPKDFEKMHNLGSRAIRNKKIEMNEAIIQQKQRAKKKRQYLEQRKQKFRRRLHYMDQKYKEKPPNDVDIFKSTSFFKDSSQSMAGIVELSEPEHVINSSINMRSNTQSSIPNDDDSHCVLYQSEDDMDLDGDDNEPQTAQKSPSLSSTATPTYDIQKLLRVGHHMKECDCSDCSGYWDAVRDGVIGGLTYLEMKLKYTETQRRDCNYKRRHSNYQNRWFY